MNFSRFVEVGRVVLINYGPDCGKVATVVDVVDNKRILVDGPQSMTGVHRQVIALKRVNLTDIVVSKLPRNATEKTLKKCWTEQNTLGKWQTTAWSKKIEAKKRRASLGDFDRFKVMMAKKQRANIISEKVAEL